MDNPQPIDDKPMWVTIRGSQRICGKCKQPWNVCYGWCDALQFKVNT